MMKQFGNASKALFVGAAIMLGLMATAGTASALPNCTPGCDFTINPNALPGVVPIPPSGNNPTPNTQIGQDLQGNYTEVLTFNPNGSWSATGWIQFAGLIAGTGNDCSPSCAAGNTIPGAYTGLNNQYDLYAQFTANGTFVPNVPNVNLTVTGFSTPGLFADYFSSFNTYNPDGTVTVVNPDTLLLTTAFISGSGTSIIDTDPTPPDTSVGSFSLFLTPTLISPDGENYFTAPRPFFIQLNLSGQFIPQGFDFTNTTTPQTFSFNNVSADMTFIPTAAVPEPASLSLLGLGLVGLARARRRRNQKL